MLTGKQIDEIQIRGMRQCSAAQPAKPQDHQVSPGDPAMGPRKLVDCRLGQRNQRSLGGARKRCGNLQRIANPAGKIIGNQLYPQREPDLTDFAPHLIEQPLVVIPCLTRRKIGRQRGDIAGQIKRAGIDQRIEQIGPPGQLIGQRRGEAEDPGQQLQQRRPRFEQPEQIDRAGQIGE